MSITSYLYNDIIKPYLELALQHYLDNPWMKLVIAFIPALLSISYPLIAQTISRLDEKYKSTHIIELFKKEPYHNYFILNLKVSVVLTLLCFIFSVKIFFAAFVSLCSLLYLFFKYLSKLLEYQSPLILLKSLIRNLNLNFNKEEGDNYIQSRKNEILKLWHPLIDLYNYAIINNDKKLEDEIRINFIYPAFGYISNVEQSEMELVKYPSEFYNSTYDIVSTYLNNYHPDYYKNIEIFTGSLFFPSPLERGVKQFYHEDTLIQIWRNLTLLIEHDRGDKILRYWESASQHFDFHLRLPYPEHDEEYQETEESIKKRKKINKYREIFLQFHTVLGSYLMYKRNFKTLKETWYFTQSQPPRYSMIPVTLRQIFDYYFTFLETFHISSQIVIRFWFKGLDFDAMNNQADVKYMVRRYACLLFIKQWKAVGYYGINPLAFPDIPEGQSERMEWSENIEYFKNIVTELLEDRELMESLGLSDVPINEVADSGGLTPKGLLDELKNQLDTQIEEARQNAELSNESVTKLDQYTIEFLGNNYRNFRRISGEDVSKKDRDSLSNTMQVIRGNRMLLNREAFVTDSGTSYVFYDEISAQTIKREYNNHIASKFSLNSTIKYEVRNGSIFNAVDKLQLDADIHVIVGFRVNFEYAQKYQNINIVKSDEESDYKYNLIDIFSYDVNNPLVFNTLYILRKQDLPMIKHDDWSNIPEMPEKTQERWRSMVKIDEDLKLYRKLTELNNSEELRAEYIKSGTPEEELKNKLEVDIDFLGYCWFRKGVKIVEIKEADKFQEGGIKNELKDIKPF